MASTNFLVDAKMGAIKPEFCNGIRVNATGRRTFAAEYKREVVAECRRRGTSVSAVALRRGLNANVLRKWLRESASGSKRASTTTLLPVSIVATPISVAVERSTTRTTQAAASVGTIEIEVGGARVKVCGVVDVDALRCVLTLLRSA